MKKNTKLVYAETLGNPVMVRASLHAGPLNADDEDDDRLYLQIEFMNDHAITLSWPIGLGRGPPAVTVWQGSGEHTFGEGTLESWREWLEGALGQKPGPLDQ